MPVGILLRYLLQVCRTAGYNYGLPRQRSSPRHDTASPRAGIDRIRVCARKRPRTATELKHNDPDVVTVCSPGRVVVNELKSALDLSKYLQKVFMRRFRVVASICDVITTGGSKGGGVAIRP